MTPTGKVKLGCGASREQYEVNGVNLADVRNRNEIRVISMMAEALADVPDFHPDPLDIEDIYALTLNNLPARYCQKGSIILHEPVADEVIYRELKDAIEKVRLNPKHGG